MRVAGIVARVQRSPDRRDVLFNLILITMAVFTFLPFYFMLITSLKTTDQMRHYFLLPTVPFHFNNYLVALEQLQKYFINTVVITSISVPAVILLSSLSAFVFARYSFPGKTILFYAVISLLMIPSVLTLVPAFIWIMQLGLLNTYWALIFPYIAGGQVFAIYLLRSFFAALPNELFDSAQMDGANRFQTYWLIALPLATPMISVIAIVNTLSMWNDYIWPLVTLQDDSMRTITIGLRYFQGQFHTNYGPLFAGYILGSIPLLILFLIAMRPFVSGLTSGAIKM
jgi:ABC-type glycerol-3-phosphate transport system permease component